MYFTHWCFRLFYVALFSFLWYSNLVVLGHAMDGDVHEEKFDYATSVVSNEFIVTFKQYLSSERRQIALQRSLNGICNCLWNEIHRQNPVTGFPSDFSLVQISNNSKLSISKLLQDPDINGVSPQRKVTRILLKATPGRTEDVPDPKTGIKCKLTNCNKGNDQWRPRKLKRSSYDQNEKDEGGDVHNTRKLLHAVPRQISHAMQANLLWAKGFNGKGVKVAVLDTGLPKNHPHFKNIKDRSDWTEEKTLDDGLGHGTFVAGVIGSQKECFGFAPEADLYIFRIFTNNQISYTSWFLDAFNYAILKNVDVLNLSIGGPDFMDKPFVNKVWELTANNVIMVSAIGNDGPLYGTLNNPADQMDVIGVGGINYEDELAKFSSRGMTTWELPSGYGRVKPDVVSYGAGVRGSSIKGGCRFLSGTSVASPVVAGAVTLLISSVADKGIEINPASIKQSLMTTAKRISNANLFEQGHGKLDLLGAYKFLSTYKPQISLSPSYIDLTECPYMWPYCSQPIFYGAMPIIINTTVLNGMGVTGKLASPPIWQPTKNGDYVEIGFTHSPIFWPWSGFLAIYITASKQAIDWDGIVEGVVNITVTSPPKGDEVVPRYSNTLLPIRIKIAKPPHRSKRILWDQYHNLRYPSGYFPRDNLKMKQDPLDWNADHIHTNFKDLYTYLRQEGYYIDVLGSPLTCFDAKQYGTLLLVDSEEEYFKEEIIKLHKDYQSHNLSIIIIGEWFNTAVMKKIKFYDENTRQWWVPDTGGANVPALNDLLSPWGVAFSDEVYWGEYNLMGKTVPYSSGTTISKFPSDGKVLYIKTLNNQAEEVLTGIEKQENNIPVMGFYDSKRSQSGRLIVYGDSNCFDTAHMETDCFWLMKSMLEYANTGQLPDEFENRLEIFTPKDNSVLPVRPLVSNFNRHSKVLQNVVGSDSHRPLPHCPSLKWTAPEPIDAAIKPYFPSVNYEVKQGNDFGNDAFMTQGASSAVENIIYLWPLYIVSLLLIFMCFMGCKCHSSTSNYKTKFRGNNYRRRFNRNNQMDII